MQDREVGVFEIELFWSSNNGEKEASDRFGCTAIKSKPAFPNCGLIRMVWKKNWFGWRPYRTVGSDGVNKPGRTVVVVISY